MKKGFTLIELLLVIAIISTLATVMLVGSQGYTARARDTERVSDLAQIRVALELYFSACRQYPSALNTTASNGCPPNITLGSFISSIPEGNPAYTYDVDSETTPTRFILRAELEQNAKELNDDIDDSDAFSIDIDCTDTAEHYYYCIGS
jgi:prepilin-type N-terminal cleavage/methylation domain-containing protein